MVAIKKYIVLCAALVLAGAADDFRCYDCAIGEKQEECIDPERNGIRTLNCKENNQADQSENTAYICVSVYVKNSGNDSKSGVSRSCEVLNPDIGGFDKFCDWYKEKKNDGQIKISDCKACNESVCNKQILNPDKTFNTASTAVHYTLFVLVVNALICIGAI